MKLLSYEYFKYIKGEPIHRIYSIGTTDRKKFQLANLRAYAGANVTQDNLTVAKNILLYEHWTTTKSMCNAYVCKYVIAFLGLAGTLHLFVCLY